jgi:hypothetical protein
MQDLRTYAAATADFYVVARHHKAATVLTSNRSPDEWLAIMTDPLLAQSAEEILDRCRYGPGTPRYGPDSPLDAALTPRRGCRAGLLATAVRGGRPPVRPLLACPPRSSSKS